MVYKKRGIPKDIPLVKNLVLFTQTWSRTGSNRGPPVYETGALTN